LGAAARRQQDLVLFRRRSTSSLSPGALSDRFEDGAGSTCRRWDGTRCLIERSSENLALIPWFPLPFEGEGEEWGGTGQCRSTRQLSRRGGSTRLCTPRLGTPRLGTPRLGTPRLGTPRLGDRAARAKNFRQHLPGPSNRARHRKFFANLDMWEADASGQFLGLNYCWVSGPAQRIR
jgi:hypothetical protein